MIRRVVDLLIRFAIHILCRVESDGLEKVPLSGPLIIVSNHINFLEVPIIYLALRPRRVLGMAKKET